jgi:hypothetical protein
MNLTELTFVRAAYVAPATEVVETIVQVHQASTSISASAQGSNAKPKKKKKKAQARDAIDDIFGF